MLLYNPYDLIIIKENVIPEENLEQIMLLTNNTKDISNATVINKDKEDGCEENLETRHTLWYNITEEMHKQFEQAVASCFREHVAPRYNCQFKSYEPVQFLGYPVGGHYKGHNDGEHFNMETRQWERIKPKKGMMIAFPSYKDFAHKVHPVTWGHRYTLVSWVATQKNLYDTIPRPGIPES